MNTQLLSSRPSLRSVARCALAVCALLVACTARSLWLNRALRRSVDVVVEAGEAPGHKVSIADIERLRTRIDALRALDANGPPWSMRFGMYRGREVLARATATWVGWVRRSLIETPLRASDRNLESLLPQAQQFVSAEAVRRVLYDGLELHLALTSPKEPSEPTLAQPSLSEVVVEALVRASCADAACDRPSRALLHRNIRRYLDLLRSGAVAPIDRRPTLVQRVREGLNHRPHPYQEINQIVADVDDGAPVFDAISMLAGLPASFTLIRVCMRPIPGALTRRGWERSVRDRLSLRADPRTQRWVLGLPGSGPAIELSQLVQLRSHYFDMYYDAWSACFYGNVISTPRNLSESLEVLRWLTSVEGTPFAAWVRVVADNLRLEEQVDSQSLANAEVAERALLDTNWGRDRRVWVRREFTHREFVAAQARENFSTFFAAPGEDDAAIPTPDVTASTSTLRQCGEQLTALDNMLRAMVDGARIPTEAEIRRMDLLLDRQEAIALSANASSRVFIRGVCSRPLLAAIENACVWSHVQRGASTVQARQRCPSYGLLRWPR